MHDHGAMILAASGDLGLVALAAAAAGLLGSMTHCALMCGPFVLAQVAARLDGTSTEYGVLQRLAGAALLPYHLGRLTTYVLLGALAGALSGLVGTTFGLLPSLMLVAAALVFAGWSVAPLARLVPRPAAAVAARLAAAAAPLFGRPTGGRGYALGVALGLLPCGLVYGTLAAAAGTGSAAGGAVVMAAFALGTVPALVGVAYAGRAFGRRWAPQARVAAPAVMLASATALLWIALA
ncbi:MAG: sulfite exporter TauE/SafE family protein [Alphaproteobacteria bacterium]